MPNPKPNLAVSARININGNTGWLLGANLPWIKCGGDFGGNNWGSYGIGSSNPPPPPPPAPLSSEALRTTFQAMQAAGVNVARWFLFFDGRAGIRYDTVSGSPTGLDGAVLRDIDEAVAIAKSYSIKIIFVLISFEWMKKKINNVVGGRSEILSDPAKQDDLVNNVFVPLFRHLADDTSVVAYDVANEPEWSLLGVPDQGGIDPSLEPVQLDAFRGFVTKVSRAAQLNAPAQYVTLGSARAKWVGIWQGLGLDFYQFHYYPQTEDPNTLLAVLPDLPPGIDRPIWLGEFPANVAEDADYMRARLEDAFNAVLPSGAGLAGAAPWSMRDVGDGFGPGNTDVLREFSDAHSPDINSGVARTGGE
jgi:hypothetical protein